MFRENDIELVKSSVNMVQLAEAYGFKVNHKGYMLCPFHQDNRPSMQVFKGNTAKDGFYCYSCGKGGNIIQFVQEYEGLNFDAAVGKIAAMFHIPIGSKIELSAADKQRIADQKAARERERQAQEASRQRMIELSEKIRRYEQLIREVTPFGELFCWLANRLPVMQAEWEERFEQTGR